MRRVTWFALVVAWSVYAVLVALGWRTASAAPPDADSQLLVAAAWGLGSLLLVTSWLHDRESGAERNRPRGS